MMTPASAGTFALRHPEHDITVSLKQLATRWLEQRLGIRDPGTWVWQRLVPVPDI